MTASDQKKIDDNFKRLEALFREGRISELWSQLQPINERNLEEKHRRKYYYYTLSCAVYEVGDINRAMRLNRTLDFSIHPTMRYRLCLRQKDFVTARRLRHAYDYNESILADFRYTLGLHCLAKGKFKFGFHFYQERYRAINTPKSLMEPLQYHYLTQNPEEDPKNIILEQGMGEVLISLIHIKNSGLHKDSNFCGMPKYRRLVNRLFPEAKYYSRLKLSEFDGQHAILALDFLKRSWLEKKTFESKVALDKPLKTRHSKPRFGICWRGGSAQNRREERHIPLQFFVESLPKRHNYIVLQYDVTEQEREFLSKYSNIQIPLVDLTDDTLVSFDLVRELAGVISVAGANWHLAGCANIPFLAIMHSSAHWLWGRNADAKSVYPSATTIAKEAFSYSQVDLWSQSALTAWQSRDIEDYPAELDLSERPVFITGLPSSALTQIMEQFAKQGIWHEKNINNRTHKDPIESLGNSLIRHRLLFNILKRLNANIDGTLFPPSAEQLPPFPWLHFQIERALNEQGYRKGNLWALKDFRLALLWPLLARAYPNATWVIVKSSPEKVASELANHPHYSQQSTSTEYWRSYINAFNERLNALDQSSENIAVIDADNTSTTEANISSILSSIQNPPQAFS